MRIALTGPMFSGKTTLAHYLSEHTGMYLMDYTASLKERAADALAAATGNFVSVEDIVANKNQYRPFLQALGSAIGYDKGFGVDEMLYAYYSYLESEADDKHLRTGAFVADADIDPGAVFDNVRFPAQFERLKEDGFVLVGLKLPRLLQLRRASALGVSEYQLDEFEEHDAEQWIEPEITLDATKTTEELANVIARLSGLRLRGTGLSLPDRERIPTQPLAATTSYPVSSLPGYQTHIYTARTDPTVLSSGI